MKPIFKQIIKRKIFIILLLIHLSILTITFLTLKISTTTFPQIVNNTIKAKLNNNLHLLQDYKISLIFYLKQPLNQNYIIDFCNQYNWILSYDKNQTGFYNKTAKKKISQIIYPDFITKKTSKICQINLTLHCQLNQKKVIVFIDDKFYEEINLDYNNLHFYFNIITSIKITSLIKKLYLHDEKGNIIFNYAYSLANDKYSKILINSLLALGIFTLILIIFSEKKLPLLKYIIIIYIIVLIEFFLRLSQKDNPNFNALFTLNHSKWNIEEMTNLFKNHNKTQTITPYKTNISSHRKTYYCQPNQQTSRILCLGASPTEAVHIKEDEIFSFVLEKKLNTTITNKYEVINAGVTGNIFKFAIYLKDVLIKLKPKIIIIYCPYAVDSNDFKILQTIKKLLQNHSSWITTNELLFTALEFKYPSKPLVYTYNFLRNSFLFMGLEYIRKHFFKKTPYLNINTIKKTKLFEYAINIIATTCYENNIKLILIPQMYYPEYIYPEEYLNILLTISKKNKHIFYLDPRNYFKQIKNTILFYDDTHLVSFGHKIFAKLIYDKLLAEKLIK